MFRKRLAFRVMFAPFAHLIMFSYLTEGKPLTDQLSVVVKSLRTHTHTHILLLPFESEPAMCFIYQFLVWISVCETIKHVDSSGLADFALSARSTHSWSTHVQSQQHNTRKKNTRLLQSQDYSFRFRLFFSTLSLPQCRGLTPSVFFLGYECRRPDTSLGQILT